MQVWLAVQEEGLSVLDYTTLVCNVILGGGGLAYRKRGYLYSTIRHWYVMLSWGGGGGGGSPYRKRGYLYSTIRHWYVMLSWGGGGGGSPYRKRGYLYSTIRHWYVMLSWGGGGGLAVQEEGLSVLDYTTLVCNVILGGGGGGARRTGRGVICTRLHDTGM